MLVDNGSADGQAQSGAAFETGIGRVYLLESAKDCLQLVGRNAAAGVDDGDGDAVYVGAHEHGDGRVARREFDGVREQVGDDLQKAIGVGGNFSLRLVVDQLHTGGIGYGRHAVDGLANDLVELYFAEDQALTAAFQPFQIENVVDQADEPVGVCQCDAEQVCGLVVQLHQASMREQSERAANCSERGAQLVADGGDELVLEAIEGVALADVAEAQDGAGKAAMIEDRSERVIDAEGAGVDAEDGVLAGSGHQLQTAGGAQQRAIFPALAACRSVAVEQIVDCAARKRGSRRTEHSGSSWIGEADQPIAVESADAIGHGVEQDLLLAVELFGPAAIVRAGQHLSQRGRDRFNGSHGLAIFAQGKVAIKLENGEHAVANFYRNRT